MEPCTDICIRFPFFHSASGPAPIPAARRLALGTSSRPASDEWLPSNYPFTIAEANAVLQDLGRFDSVGLEAMRHMGTRFLVGEVLREQTERQALDHFAGVDCEFSPYESLRRHAHKILLWLWHMEDQWAEVAIMAARCRAAERRLGYNFSELDRSPLPEAIPAEMEKSPDMWRTRLSQAALFIPAHLPVFMEGSMREELLERFSSAAMPQWGEAVAGFTASVGEVLNQPPAVLGDMEDINDIYNEKRLWLALR